MARNKYPEETVEKILTAARKLFLEKGYEKTTIQDIVDQLGGLTKGAVYHHFKSKEEIMDAIGDKMFQERNPFETVRGRTDLNGLEKLREVVSLTQAPDWAKLSRESIPLLKNPRILAGNIQSNREIAAPYFLELIEEGNRDGSIHTEYPRELAELLTLLPNLWLAPTVYPGTREDILRRFRCFGEMLDHMGLPLVDEHILRLAEDFFRKLDEEHEG
ncbi:MAG: TetR/AcrR family transcriptional regulator [Oscillospiraceae bacterium]|nr:TetR/AcrR family transcriptional regulator [Oscillospiraceae bacterium]